MSLQELSVYSCIFWYQSWLWKLYVQKWNISMFFAHDKVTTLWTNVVYEAAVPSGEVVCMTEKQSEIVVATRSRQVLGKILGDWSPSQSVLSYSVCHHLIDTHLSQVIYSASKPIHTIAQENRKCYSYQMQHFREHEKGDQRHSLTPMVEDHSRSCC